MNSQWQYSHAVERMNEFQKQAEKERLLKPFRVSWQVRSAKTLHGLAQRLKIAQELVHRWILLSLLLLLFGCGGNLVPGQPLPPGTPVPNDLTGQWQTAISAYPGTSDYLASIYEFPFNISDLIEVQTSTLGISFYFFEDGRYEHVWIWDTVYAIACVRTLMWEEKGTVNIAGSDFTFHPAQATFTALDICEGLEAQEPTEAKTMTLAVTRAQDAAGWPLLRFGYPSGDDLVLEKCKTCE